MWLHTILGFVIFKICSPEMAKATTVYVAFAQTSNDDASAYSVSSGGHGAQVVPAQAGDSTGGLSVGVIHSF